MSHTAQAGSGEVWLLEFLSGCLALYRSREGTSVQILSPSVPSDKIYPEQQGQSLLCHVRSRLCFPALHSAPLYTQAALRLGPLRTFPSLPLAEQGEDQGTVFQRRAAAPWQQKFGRLRCSGHPPSRLCRLQVPAPGRWLPWLLGGRGHLRGDEGLNDTVVGRQQVAVAVGGFGTLVQHQAAGGHCRGK